MSAVEWLKSVNPVDAILVVVLFGMFVIGYASGSVRRGTGLLAITFAFLVAGQVDGPLGSFLAQNWTQFPQAYSYMIGFLAVFLAAVIALFIVIQANLHTTHLFPRWPVVDEILGGVLGMAEGYLALLFLVTILDTYFRGAVVASDAELPFLRSLWSALDSTWLVAGMRSEVAPVLVMIGNFLLPASIRDLYPG